MNTIKKQCIKKKKQTRRKNIIQKRGGQLKNEAVKKPNPHSKTIEKNMDITSYFFSTPKSTPQNDDEDSFGYTVMRKTDSVDNDDKLFADIAGVENWMQINALQEEAENVPKYTEKYNQKQHINVAKLSSKNDTSKNDTSKPFGELTQTVVDPVQSVWDTILPKKVERDFVMENKILNTIGEIDSKINTLSKMK